MTEEKKQYTPFSNEWEEIPLPNGCTLFCKPNEVGGRTYVSDEVGGGVHVWDTALVDQTTLLAAVVHEAHLSIAEFHARQKEEQSKTQAETINGLESGNISETVIDNANISKRPKNSVSGEPSQTDEDCGLDSNCRE